MAHTGVRPFKITVHSTELSCDVRRTVGFQSYCACGDEGPIRKTLELAQWDKRVHIHKMHRGKK